MLKLEVMSLPGGYRWMYYATGLPGWMRFGFSPGWIGRSPTGLGPCATYLLTGQWPTPLPQVPLTGTYPSVGPAVPVTPLAPGAGALGALGATTKEQQVSILENQAKLLEDQLKAIQERLNELKSKS